MRVLRNEFVEEMSPRMWKRLSSYVSLLNSQIAFKLEKNKEKRKKKKNNFSLLRNLQFCF